MWKPVVEILKKVPTFIKKEEKKRPQIDVAFVLGFKRVHSDLAFKNFSRKISDTAVCMQQQLGLVFSQSN